MLNMKLSNKNLSKLKAKQILGRKRNNIRHGKTNSEERETTALIFINFC